MKIRLIVLFTLALGGCGGGGSSEPPPVQPTPPAPPAPQPPPPPPVEICYFNTKHEDSDGDGSVDNAWTYQYSDTGLLEKESTDYGNDDTVEHYIDYQNEDGNRQLAQTYVLISGTDEYELIESEIYSHYQDEDGLRVIEKSGFTAKTIEHYNAQNQLVKLFRFDAQNPYFSSYSHFEYDERGVATTITEYLDGDAYEPRNIYLQVYQADSETYEYQEDLGADGSIDNLNNQDFLAAIDQLGDNRIERQEIELSATQKKVITTQVSQYEGTEQREVIAMTYTYDADGNLSKVDEDIDDDGSIERTISYSDYSCYQG